MIYKGVLFDLDGTLLNTIEDISDAANAVMRRHGFPEHTPEGYRYWVGEGVEQLLRRAIPGAKLTPTVLKTCVAELKTEYAHRRNQKTRPYEGILELLSALTDKQVKTAVLSNKPDDVVQGSVKMFLSKHAFDFVTGVRDPWPLKPDPTVALKIARHLNLPPEELVYLGDTGVDMITARRAEMYPVGALWGFRDAGELKQSGAKKLISTALELLTLFPDPCPA
ncbi:MAG: HAD family hydrolase [Fidelibacterota bacterium]